MILSLLRILASKSFFAKLVGALNVSKLLIVWRVFGGRSEGYLGFGVGSVSGLVGGSEIFRSLLGIRRQGIIVT